VSVEVGNMQNDIFPLEGKINFEFELPLPVMEKKAKPTTILYAVPIGGRFLILKNYFIDFLYDFGITEMQRWNIKVKHVNKYYDDYSLFNHNCSLQRSLIDFENSSFFLGKFSDYLYVGKDLKISNYDNYLNMQDVLRMKDDNFLKYSKIILNLDAVNMDMFKLWITPLAGYYVSEKLKNAIEEQRFTGFKFTEIDKISDKIIVNY
jgi:hypothetical protein